MYMKDQIRPPTLTKLCIFSFYPSKGICSSNIHLYPLEVEMIGECSAVAYWFISEGTSCFTCAILCLYQENQLTCIIFLFPAFTVWCRRTDELVDGPNASHITPSALDRWESRLDDLFQGRPFDMLDAALSDTVSKFPVDIQVVINFKIHIKTK